MHHVLLCELDGIPALTYAVAVDNLWYDDDGKSHEECDFIPVSTTGKQRAVKFLHKSSPVAVEGRLRSWWKAEESRGGFNFKAIRVQYLGKAGGARDGQGDEGGSCQTTSDQDEWLSGYDAAERLASNSPAPVR